MNEVEAARDALRADVTRITKLIAGRSDESSILATAKKLDRRASSMLARRKITTEAIVPDMRREAARLIDLADTMGQVR